MAHKNTKAFYYILAFIYSFQLNAKQIEVRVSDANSGEPLQGATVSWEGTNNGGLTSANGKVVLQKPDSIHHLITSFWGYATDTTFVSEFATTVKIRMREAESYKLNEVEIATERNGTTRLRDGAMQVEVVSGSELVRAACCNLGESFTTNPSVDVNYNDAATGARQIKLLGLSGTYVQMLTENIPNFRGAATPYSLGYIPGPWMQSIQISKGSATVKNGHESITGQINVEYLKPQTEEEANLNLFLNSKMKVEANADGNIHLNKALSTAVLAHYEDLLMDHDGNDDGFLDMPKSRQWNIMNRWMYRKRRYIMQSGIKVLGENRRGGQTNAIAPDSCYKIGIETKRCEFFSKNAFILDYNLNANIAFIISGSFHKQEAGYGRKNYDVDEGNAYGALLFETEFSKRHSLSTGYNFMHDDLKQDFKLRHAADVSQKANEVENTHGIYAQYTFNHHEKIVVVAGIRGDYSNKFGGFITPRMNVKWNPSQVFSLRLSAGKGYRSPHALAENNYLLASSRNIYVADDLKQEKAWNFGASTMFNIKVHEKDLSINLDYYYTHFLNQTIIDLDANPHGVSFYNLDGKAFSHTFQIDATYPFFDEFSIPAAFRVNDVKSTYHGTLREQPLTSRYKGLLTATYKTPLELWQFDVTCQLNGGGRMPDPYRTEDGELSWNHRYKAFPQLSAQVTRIFKWGSIYIGGENLTNFKQDKPIIDSGDPWSDNFDATLIWGPIDGAMAYIGARIKLTKNDK